MKNWFEELSAIDVGSKIEQKNGLNYLPWMDAWAELKKRYPLSYATVYETPEGMLVWRDPIGCHVKTSVTLVWDDEDGSHEHTVTEYLPVMDVRNKAVPYENVDSMMVNKTIQRSLTKCIARLGVAEYIFRGDDLPEELKLQKEEEAKQAEAAKKKASQELDDLRQKVIEAATKKINEEKIPQEAVYQVIKDLNNGNKNPNSIKSASVMKKVLAAIQEMKVSA